MTPESQRIAIAEACGITEIHREVPGGRTVEFWTGMTGDNFCSVCVPDYLNDLNAMHKAEKSLAALPYLYKLQDVVLAERDERHTSGGLSKLIRATAAQRAEAFLKAIGKWEK